MNREHGNHGSLEGPMCTEGTVNQSRQYAGCVAGAVGTQLWVLTQTLLCG